MIKEEEFWDVVRNRVRELNDTQLTTGFARRARRTLDTALLLINAKIAYAAAERSDVVVAQRHIKTLHRTDFSHALIDQAVREAIKPVRNRIKTAIDNARSQWTDRPQHAHHHVRDLYHHAKELLVIVDAILPEDDLTRSGIHDTVAEALHDGVVVFADKTNDWSGCMKLVELAQKVALGERLKTRLADVYDTLQNNAKAGNDWYSPGYWDLPDNVIEELEKAHEYFRAGNMDKAINVLLKVDMKAGHPLDRALAFCLSIHGVRLGNEAFSGISEETSVLKRILMRILHAGERDLMAFLANVPNTSAYVSNPPCMSCQNRYYTSWVRFTYKQLPLFMCSDCNTKHQAELQQQQNAVKGKVSNALEYLLLASEMDPEDPSIAENLTMLKEAAGKIDCHIPSTRRLVKELGGRVNTSKSGGTYKTLPASPHDGTCYFCGSSHVRVPCQIKVPMCGEAYHYRYSGMGYHHTDVVIPRCKKCQNAHHKIAGEITAWQRRCQAAIDQADLSTLDSELQRAQANVELCLKNVEYHQTCIDAATQELNKPARTNRLRCPQCKSAENWDDGLCRKCDIPDDDLLEGMSFVKNACIFVMLLVAPIFIFGGLYVIGLLILIVAMSVLVVCNVIYKKRLETLFAEMRFEMFTNQPEKNELANQQLHNARDAHKASQKQLHHFTKIRNGLENKIRDLKRRSALEYEQANPMPQMPDGMKYESSYVQFHQIRELLLNGWGFGKKQIDDAGHVLCKTPIEVVGLVGDVPDMTQEPFSWLMSMRAGSPQVDPVHANDTQVSTSK